ncbi:hypothetical protein SAMN02910275_02308 [Butyrivibrio sp. INlla18]|uniref:hypothetical protein n=1 Tax=Butyrivibrio sp. INlla18 TaxID=1520806 RepID=UPI00088219A9|nr:hypothetical protein [Butyrivibrio sp. INlla18]SDA70762.1 hypothetical protein SAMN02910275_02308 [Butyrivibrio sp. INlla18]
MSEVIQMAKSKEVRYYKPNMGALRGRIGESIIETILNTPRPDHKELDREADEYLRIRLAGKTK